MRKFIFLSVLSFLFLITKLSAFTLSATNESGISGSQVVVPITVKDFNKIISMQGTIQWDASVATYASVEQYGLNGLSSSNFGTSKTSSGKLTFSWFESDLVGVTLSDNSVIFAIRFTLIGAAGTTSNVSFTSSPTTIEVIDENMANVTVTTSTGIITVTGTTNPCLSNPVVASVLATNTTCGNSNGTASTTVSGGTSPYTYAWSNGASTSSATNLAAGSYTVTVTDANSCTATETATISSSSAVTAAASSTDATCGQSNGTATATASSGTSPYTYSWSNGKTTASLTGLATGTYTVTITDAKGCTATATTTVNSSNGPTVTTASVNTTCGESNGTAAATASGGTSPYTYLWSNGASTSSATNLAAGTYTVTVTDSKSCSTTESVTIVTSTAVSATVSSTNETNLLSNGTATVTASGGTSPYTYLWSNGASSSSATNLAAGTYTVTVTDANGCSTTKSVTITNTTTTTNDTLAFVLGTATGISGSQVTIPVKVANFTDVVSIQGTIQWNTSVATYASVQSFGLSGMNASNFGTTLTSSGKLTFSWNDANLTGQTLADSTVIFTITYTLVGNAGDQTSLDFKNSPTSLEFIDKNFNPLSYNVYSGKIEISSATDPCILNPPSVNLGGDVVLCNGNSETLSAGTGFSTYSWSTGSNDQHITVSTAGTYYVTVTDANGCTASDTVVVTAASAGCSELFISEYVEGSSNNKAIEIYNPTSSTISLSSYKIVLYNNGSATSSATITLSGSIAAKDVYVLTHSSAGSTLKALADQTSGSLGYNGDDVVALTKNGTIIDQVGQIGQATVWTVGSGTTQDHTLVRKSSVNAGQTNWTVGVTEWDAYSSDTFTNLGSHTSNCSNTSSGSAGADVTICKGETTTLNASGGSSYLWHTSSTLSSLTIANPVAEPKTTTTYIVDITDANGCVTSDSVTVTVNPLPTLTLTSTKSTNGQADGTATVVASGGSGTYTYSWNTSPVQTTSTATGLLAGTYVVTVTDGNCSTTGTVTVQDSTIVTDPCILNPPSVNLGGDVVLCTNTSTTLSAGTGFSTYSWSTGSNDEHITVSTAGTYYVTITDANGCTASDTIVVTMNTTSGCSELFLSEYVEGSSNNKAVEIYNPTNAAISLTGYKIAFYNNGSLTVNGTITLVGSIAAKDVFVLTHSSATSSLKALADMTSAAMGYNGDDVVALTKNGTVIDQVGEIGQATVWTVGSGTTQDHTLVRKSSVTAGQTNWTVGATEWDAYATDTYTYLSTHTSSCGNAVPSAGSDVAICEGSNTTLNASGGTAYQWHASNTLSSLTIANPVAEPEKTTIYIVDITDGNGCVSTDSVTVTVNDAPSISLSSTNATCGQSNGTATATVTGGKSPYTYVWSNGETSSSITALSEASYIVTVTDANGCSSSDTVKVESYSSPVVTITAYDATCGQNNGGVSASVTGGKSPYTYLWNNGKTTSAFTGIAAGTYIVTVTDANGCIATDTALVNSSAGLTVTVSTTNAKCSESNGEVAASVSGGTSPYTYSWSNGASTSSATNLAAGSYTVTVTDSKGCTGTATATVTSTTAPTVTISASNATCGNSNGAATAAVSGGTSPYTYVWSNGKTTASITGLSSGAYYVTVTDANGCTGKATTTVSSSTGPSVTIATTKATCGQSNGYASATVTGGTSPYTYLWSNGQTTSFDQSLAAGSYTLIVTDANGCTTTSTATISNSNGPSVSVVTTAATCGNSNGTATATASSGTSPYTYSWSNGASTSSATSLAAGSYSVTITDANGCTATETVTISSSSSITIKVSSANASCGQSNGGAYVTVSGGTSPYTYLWSNGNTTYYASNLAAGTYTVKVTDANGCSSTETVTISSTSGPSIKVSTTDASCGQNNGYAEATVTGGTSPYTYSWSNGASTSSATNLAAGSYTVTVTDANGCTATATANISNTSGPTVSVKVTDDYCTQSKGKATANVTGGTGPYTYLWSNGKTTYKITNLSAGTYSLIVTDANGCSTTQSITVIDNAAPTLTVSSTDAVNGNANGTATVVVTGGTGTYTYSWSTTPVQTTSTATGLLPGTYTVTVSDGNCTATESVVVNDTVTTDPCILNPITIDLGGDKIICKGESVTLDAGAGFVSYLWSNGATTQTISVNTASAYAVTVTDKNGCTAVDEVHISFSTVPLVNLGGDIVLCQNTSTVIDAGNGYYAYSWSTGENTSSIVADSAGTYYVTVTDSNGCSSSDTVVVDVNTNTISGCNELYLSEYIEGSSNNKSVEIFNPTSGSIDLVNYSISIYTNGSLTASSTINLKGMLNGGDVFVLSNPSAAADILNVTDLTTGSINFNGNDVVTLDKNGVVIDKIGEIGQSTSWTVDTGSTENYTLVRNYNVTTGQTNWIVGATEWDVYSIDTYSYLGYHNSLCSQLQTPDAGNDVNICQGDTVQLNAKGGKTYEWYTSSSLSDVHVANPFATPSTTTTYYIDIINNNGCKFTDSVTVYVNAASSVNIGNDTIVCQSTYTLNAGTGYNSYLWSTGQTTSTLTVANSGIYTVYVTNQYACVSSDEIEVVLMGGGSISLGNDTSVCNTDPMVINAGTGYTYYSWSTGSNDVSITVTQSGSYSVTVLDTNGCKSSDTLVVKLGAGVGLGSNLVLCNGNAVVINAGSGYASYLWSTGATSQDITVTSSGNYAVVAIDKANCASTDTIEVSMDNTPSVVLGNDTAICKGASVTLDAGSGFSSYIWSNGDSTQTIKVTDGGYYTVNVVKANGCVSVDSVDVTVYLVPSVTFGPTQYLCSGSSYTINAGSGYASYLWSNGSTDTSITVTTNGYYYVLVSDTNGCSTSGGVQVEQYKTPAVNLGADTVLCQGDELQLNAGTGYVSYHWSTGASTQTVNVTTIGTYSVMVEDTNGCTSMDTITIAICAGIAELSENITIQLFPNPVSEELNVVMTSSSGNKGIDKVEVFNSIGELISSKMVMGEKSANISFLNKSEGVYTIRVFSREHVISQMVTKVN